MSTTTIDRETLWHRQLHARVGDLDEFRCALCHHTDDHRREAHYVHCPVITESIRRDRRIREYPKESR